MRSKAVPNDHALASIHDLGWYARIVDGKRGFRLTIGGGTSILPTSGYLLYDFLPAEQMLEVAEAIVRVYHRFGDYKHRQRNRMKFLIKELGWEGWRQKYEEALAEVRREGRRALRCERRGDRGRRGADVGPPAGAVNRPGEAQRRRASTCTVPASCRDR